MKWQGILERAPLKTLVTQDVTRKKAGMILWRCATTIVPRALERGQST